MRTAITLSILFFSGVNIFGQHKLEVEGKVKISEMDEANTAESVVVWQSDSSLARRDVSTLNFSGWMLNLDTTYTLNKVGIGTSSPIVLGPDRVLEMMSDAENFGSIIQMSNKDRQHYLRLFGGRVGDPHPSLGWKQYGDLKFVTDEGGYSEKFRIGSDGLVTVQNRITNVADPVDVSDAATKAYVDQMSEMLLDAGINGVVQDFDGNVYKTIKIGNQVWMAENLKTTRYNDGTPILKVTENIAWQNLSTPGYCWYANDSAMHAKLFGALYNYYVVADINSRNVCPVGWDVPSDDDWTILTDFFVNNGYGYGGSGTGIGKSMAATFRWTNTGAAGQVGNDLGSNNSSGVSGLPGGDRDYNGSFGDLGSIGYWWSSTESGALFAWFRNLVYDGDGVYLDFVDKRRGYSVRCIRD